MLASKKLKAFAPYFYILPALLLLIFIYANSITRVIWYSLTEWNGFVPTTRFNWFQNYIAVFHDPNFVTSIQNSLVILVAVIPALLILAVIVSQFLYMGIRGSRFYKVIFFFPVILPIAVVGVVFTFILSKEGPLNQILNFLHLNMLAIDWFASPRYAIFGLVMMIIWKDIGFAIVLFLARLMNTSPSLYESARIDGANELQLIRHITLPQLKGVILLYSILSCISLLSSLFSYIFVTTNGGPGYSTTVLEYYIYLYTFRLGNMGQGTAVAVILFALTAILSAFYLKEFDKEEDLH